MANFVFDKLISPLFLVLLFCAGICRAQTVPATYVFGDRWWMSETTITCHFHFSKPIFPTYNGIDYLGRLPTGRFSNGKNAADVLAEQLGLPTAPPYLSQPFNVFVKGVSFASGGAGILNTSDPPLLANAVQQHLSKSLFPVLIGSNDTGYFPTNSSEMAKRYTPQQYVTLLLSNLKEQLKGIYGLGGRKFLFVGVPPVGCTPRQRSSSATNECNEEVNNLAIKYNEELRPMLATLQSELKDFRYSFFDTYSIFLDSIMNPTIFGFNETRSACCGLGKLRAELPCTPLAVFCSDRSSHIFWDLYHPTEAAARIFISKLFDGGYVTPVTVEQLISL